MILLRKEEEEKFSNYADVIACTIHKNSARMLAGKNPPKNREELSAMSDSIGKEIGDALLKKSNEFIKDMSREELIRWLTQSTAQVVINAMNVHPHFRERIALLSEFQEDGE